MMPNYLIQAVFKAFLWGAPNAAALVPVIQLEEKRLNFQNVVKSCTIDQCVLLHNARDEIVLNKPASAKRIDVNGLRLSRPGNRGKG